MNKLHKNTPEKHNLNNFTSGFTHWHHSEMLTQTEHTALNLSLSFHPLTTFCRHLSPQKNKAQLDTEQCVKCEGHLTKLGLSLAVTTSHLLSVVRVVPYLFSAMKHGFVDHRMNETETDLRLCHIYPNKKSIAIHVQKNVFWTFKYLVTQTSYKDLNKSINLKNKT